jgi:hypothetical protein
MDKKLLRCKQCNEVINLTEYDSSPEFEYDEKKQEIFERQMDDRQSFYLRHDGHELEELSIKKNSYISEDLYLEPIKVSYFEATNGSENFVVKKWRRSIEEPVKYEQIIRGRLEINLNIDIQANDIRRQIKKDIPSLSDSKIDQFIRIVQKVISQINSQKIKRITAESDNPSVFYSSLDDDSLNNIIKLSKKIFDGKEREKIKRFIYQNNDYNDVLTLVVKRHFQVKSR